MKVKRVMIALMATFAVFVGLSQIAQAQLALTGPVNAVTGFPGFYEDSTALQLQLCDVIGAGVETPPCPGLTLTVPGDGVVAGNIAEAMYYAATAIEDAPGPNGETFVVVALLEAAGAVAPDPESVINDVIIRLGNLTVLGDYTVDTPWGTFGPFTFAGPAPGRIDGDSGVGALGLAPLFDGARTGPITVFIGNGTGAAFPGHLGDGITPAPLLAAGPNGSVINVTGPAGLTFGTANFAVEGKVLGILPRFTDVLTNHFAFTQIDAIAGFGITGGCQVTPPMFCPDNPVTRAQMAVFIETSLGNPAPAACTGTMFTDVTAAQVGVGFCNFIEAFANRGITGGCAADDPLIAGNQARFCPNDNVTRAQMAVFIEAALGGIPVTPCGTRFSDVPSTHAFCGFIERLAADGITGGCTGTTFCPDNPVSRAQMAIFIVAAPTPLLPDPPAPPPAP